MLQLQLKDRVALKLPKKTIFFIKLSVFCAVVHLCALIFFFLVPELKKTIFLDTVHTNNAPILFIPLLKTSHEKPQDHTTVIQKNSEQKETNIAVQKPLQQKKEIAKKIVDQKTVAKPALLKKTVPEKKVVPKKVQPLKKNIKPVVKKPEPKKPLPEPKKVEAVKPKPVVPEKKLVEPKTIQENAVQIVGREDMELLMLSNLLKQDILKIWKRPTNIPSEALCQVRVLLDKTGNREVIIEKSSQALALDISVRNFLLQYDFPQQAYGKELSIIF